MNLAPEPDIGSLPPSAPEGPGMDLGEPEPSTEEVLSDLEGEISPWADRVDSQDWEARGSRVRGVLLFASALAALGALAALVALGVWIVWLGPWWRGHAASVEGPDLAQFVGTPSGDVVLERPEPVVTPTIPVEGPGDEEPQGTPDEAVVEPAPAPEVAPTAPEPIVAPVPEPEPPAPAPEPAPPPKPTAPTRSTLIARGWDTVESDPDAAMAAFGEVLAKNPSDHEAAYGYGYALLEKGDTAGASPYLCRARPSPDVTIQREVDGLLARHDITCP
jgi:hypothetical protein